RRQLACDAADGQPPARRVRDALAPAAEPHRPHRSAITPSGGASFARPWHRHAGRNAYPRPQALSLQRASGGTKTRVAGRDGGAKTMLTFLFSVCQYLIVGFISPPL